MDKSNLRTSHFNIFYQMNVPANSEERIGWDDYFLLMAAVVSLRSTCFRSKYGSVIVKDNRIVGTGYNGFHSGAPHCLDIGCYRDQQGVPHGERYDLCHSVHSEVNAIIRADAKDLQGATLYIVRYDCANQQFCEASPCQLCRPICINAGLKEWVTRSEGIKGELIKQVF